MRAKSFVLFLTVQFLPAHCPVYQQGYNLCHWPMLSPPIHVDGNGRMTGVNRGKEGGVEMVNISGGGDMKDHDP